MIQVVHFANVQIPKLKGIIQFFALLGVVAVCYSFFFIEEFNVCLPKSTIHSELALPHKKSLLIRKQLLNQLEESFNKQNSALQAVILIGDGGAGKTILSRLYALSQKKCPVVWELNAETRSALISSFKKLAPALAKTPEQISELNLIQKISDPTELEKQLLIFIKKNLKHKSHWLLIYDNIETLSDISDLLPTDQNAWGTGKIIISSRDLDVQNTNLVHSKQSLVIGELSPKDSLELFTNILHNFSAHKLSPMQLDEITKFLKQIPAFPLDISLAAHCIKNMHMTFEQYLEENKTFTEDFEKSQKSFLATTYYTKTRYGIISVALEKIIQKNPEFKDLLLLLCMLDSQDIPKCFLERFENPQMVSDLLHVLKKNCLITTNEQTVSKTGIITISLHRAVQSIGFAFFKNLFENSEEITFCHKILNVIQSFEELKPDNESQHGSVRTINYRERLLLTPHLESLMQLIKKLNVADELKDNVNVHISLLLALVQKRYGHNMLLSKQYIKKIYGQERYLRHLSPEILAVSSLCLGNIYVNLADPEKALPYLKQSLTLCEEIPQSELLRLSNLNLMGVALSQKNYPEDAEKFFESALQVIESSQASEIIKEDRRAWVYMQMATHYSKYAHKDKALKAEQYILEALKIHNALHSFQKSKESNPALLSMPVCKNKARLGLIYNRLSKYQEAVDKGLKEALYILKNGKKEDKFLEAEIYCDMGEALLRDGKLDEAEKILTKSIDLAEFLLGKGAELVWQAKVYRAEARLRLKKLKDAYQDCHFVFSAAKKVLPYSNLLYAIGYYHAAVIQHRMGNLNQSNIHFVDFFKYIELYCRSFLEEKIYQDLYAKGLFMVVDSNATANLKKSTLVFSAIYGAEHPFVKDFVLVYEK